MQPLPTTLPDSSSEPVPYAQASPQQISQALFFLQEELRAHFPALPWLTWAQALDFFKPDLWREAGLVTLDYDDLTRLAQHLAAQLPQLEPPIYGPRSGYLAKQLVHYEDEAGEALTEIEADPLAYGPLVYALVTRLAIGNSVAHEVLDALSRDPAPSHGAATLAISRPTSGEAGPVPLSSEQRIRRLARARGNYVL